MTALHYVLKKGVTAIDILRKKRGPRRRTEVRGYVTVPQSGD